MYKKICDRCGCEIKKKNAIQQAVEALGNAVFRMMDWSDEYEIAKNGCEAVHLCDDCMASFHKWIRMDECNNYKNVDVKGDRK